MSTPTIIVMTIFMILISAATAVAWRHMKALQTYNASLPEMRTMVSTLNAAILHAEATIASLKSAGTAAADDIAPALPASPRHRSSSQRRPSSSGLAALVDAATKSQAAQ